MVIMELNLQLQRRSQQSEGFKKMQTMKSEDKYPYSFETMKNTGFWAKHRQINLIEVACGILDIDVFHARMNVVDCWFICTISSRYKIR